METLKRDTKTIYLKWIIAKIILEAIGSGSAKKTASRLKNTRCRAVYRHNESHYDRRSTLK